MKQQPTLAQAWADLREAVLDAITPLVGGILRFFNGPPK